ncbi:MAG: M20/M25/M40 family metallo-hydrolase [Aestuariivita sp.]|nr:M20/M25/M40 family metallo-hydrolase [Aestuariivita sp.]MCY4345890.1 M20/M25/M40 family metallo-hydrolase [Aestuariivita sp.]
MSLDAVLKEVDRNLDSATDRLLDLLRIPSISTDSSYANDCDRAAEWLVSEIQSLGITDVRKAPSSGHPMVIGHADGSGPHLLFYGHYDVQPVDPIGLWDHDPFCPQIVDTAAGKIIKGRGASDDKGQLMTFLEACRSWIAVHGELPCEITLFLEGEEECGSPSMLQFMQENKRELTADVALICDTALFDSRLPAIVTMLRGLLAEEITIIGADKDLHSGFFGGAAINPIRVLTKIIAQLHDESGKVTIPGFYDNIPELPLNTKQEWDDLGFNADAFLGDVGLNQPAGEADRSLLEMLWSRPTCDCNGIYGGYTAEGMKTVLPAEASAKISFRLVEGQDPDVIRQNLRQMVRTMLPSDCTVKFSELGAGKASRFDTSKPIFSAAQTALSEEWNEPVAFVGCGGSIPIADYFQSVLDMNSLLIGFAKDDDQIHSPNEKYDLESFHKGIRSWVRFLAEATS